MLSRLCSVAAFIALALATVILGGCINIQIVDRTPTVSETFVPEGQDRLEEHDIAVLAVDFEPPLEYDEIVALKSRGEGITLLVAVENTGANTEQNVVVEVELSDENGETIFLHQQGGIDVVVPGEIKIVQFEDTEIPFSYSYQLRVWAAPVPGETHLGDNEKVYDLFITRS
jgi:hypothetical protein